MTQLTIESIPTGWRAFYDPEGLTGEGKDREAAIVDLLEKTDDLLGDVGNAAADATREMYRLREAISDVTRERDEWKEATAQANAAIDHYQTERNKADKALEEAESERDTAVEALLAVRPYINMEAYVRIADEALKRGKPDGRQA